MIHYSDRFEIFWKLYPRRNGRLVGKVKTYEYWKKIDEKEHLMVCRAAGAYAQHYKRPLRSGEFRPEPRDPERFLRLDWWRDWLEPETRPCGFRSLSEPCGEVALPGEPHCQKHKEYIEKMDAWRIKNGMSLPKRSVHA